MSRKTISILSIFILLAMAIYFASPHILNHFIEKKIIASIEDLREKGINIQYDTFYRKMEKVTIQGIRVNRADTFRTSCQNFNGTVTSIEIANISIFPILFNKTLEIDSLTINHPEIYYGASKKKNENQEHEKLEVFTIHHLFIHDARVSIQDTVSCKSETRVAMDFQATNFSARNINLDSIQWSADGALVSLLKIEWPEKFYTLKIKQINYHAEEQSIRVDSIQVIPDYDKPEFALKSKIQSDRIHLIIPTIAASGFEIRSLAKPQVYMKNLSLHFWGDIFRDKRYPFHNPEKPLPVRVLHDLPIFIQIDTLHLTDSYVSYEEFPEEGPRAGKVFFTNLTSTITNLSNHSSEETKMKSQASFMNKGLLHVNFTFPSDPKKTYTAEGTLSDFPLSAVNPMLVPAVNAEIKSGELSKMKFHFVYNDYRSDGEVELNYTDLKLVSLQKDKKHKQVNNFLTFILNLVVKKDLDDDTRGNQKTGTILFYRDDKKSIFNYWWKSILSGIKSVYNLDRITDIDGKK